jgi:class 3 adenylate cyclase
VPDVAALPTGTVTLLFTDVEGSTRLWERHPAQMRAALAAHDALIEVLTARHGGHAMNEMSFRIAGLTNPTLQVPLGAHVVVRFINGDSRLPHGWAVIDAGSLSDQPLRSRRPALPGAVAMLFDKASGSQWPGWGARRW